MRPNLPALLILVLLSLVPVANAFEPPRDPYASSTPADPTHVLPVRVINRGVRAVPAWIKSQLLAAELIYSQCPGVRMRIEPQKTLELPRSTLADQLFDFVNYEAVFSESAFRFFAPIASGKRTDAIDIHLVDFLNPETRAAGTVINQPTNYGIAFNPEMIGWVFKVPDPEPVFPAATVIGNSVILAVDTTRLNSREHFILTEKGKGYERRLSLLAHELGHIVLESQRRASGVEYRDHWCEGAGDYCPDSNLMTAGGNPDWIWRRPRGNKVVDYGPLPAVDRAQCAALVAHPLVRRVNGN